MQEHPYDQAHPGDEAAFIPQPAAQRPRRPRRTRWLLTGGLAVALGAVIAIGVVVLPTHAAANLAGASGTPAAGTEHGFGGPGGGPGRGDRGFGLTVKTVNGTSITATDRDGASVTIHTSASTTYGRAGQTVAASAITAGEMIGAMGTRNSDGSITATHVEILLPHAGGAITAISGTTITVTPKHSGQTATIHISASTTVDRAGQTASVGDLKMGDEIDAMGTSTSDGSLNAERIEIILPHAGGAITAISGTAITLRDRSGGTLTIHTDASTKFVSVTKGTSGPVQTTISLGSLKVGDEISALGTRNSDGSLNALTVLIHPAGGADADGDGPRP